MLLPSPSLLLDMMRYRSPHMRELASVVNRTVHNPQALKLSGIDPNGTTIHMENGSMALHVNEERRLGFILWSGNTGHSLAIAFTHPTHSHHYESQVVFVFQPEDHPWDLHDAAMRTCHGGFEHQVRRCDSPEEEAARWYSRLTQNELVDA